MDCPTLGSPKAKAALDPIPTQAEAAEGRRRQSMVLGEYFCLPMTRVASRARAKAAEGRRQRSAFDSCSLLRAGCLTCHNSNKKHTEFLRRDTCGPNRHQVTHD